MKKTGKKALSLWLSLLIVVSMLTPAFMVSYGASNNTITITDESGAEITERQTIQEYNTVQLKYTTLEAIADGEYVEWSSNLPLLAGVDENGVVKGYDYSKSAVIQLWLDENIRVLPIVGDSMADQIWNSLTSTGVDLDDMNNEVIVAIVRGIAGDALANSLEAALNNMNVKISATLKNADGKEIASDTVEFVVEKSTLASVIPTGVHITNRNVVPLDVAVGKTVQLYGAVTPVRLHHDVKWSVGKNVFDTESKKHAKVSSDGVVTFTSAGTASILVQDASNLAFSSYITFNVLDPADLPVETYDIVGTASVKEGETTQLAISNIVPEGAYTGDLVWSVADSSIAVIDQNGNITGLDGGDGYLEYSKTTQVTAVAGGVTKTIDFKVTRSGVTGNLSAVEIDGPDAIPVGSETEYKSNVTPARLNENKSVYREWGLKNHLTDEIVWATDEAPATDDYISVNSNGVVTALASGQVTLVARATFNKQSIETQKDVTVGKAIESFDISGKTSVVEGNEIQLSIANILPADYDEEILATAVWSVENPKVASVTQDGLVKGLDCGGSLAWSNQSTNVTVSVGGISKTISIKVTYKAGLSKYTGGEILGLDYVIKDFPMEYSAVHSPERVNISRQFWGVAKDDGSAPWKASTSMGITNFSGNMENSVAKVECATDGSASTGKVVGLQAGTTTIHTYMANLLTTYLDLQKEITVVELEPKSIKITPPSKADYVEGSVDLDLSDMVVELTYSREDIAQYYGEEYANSLTDEQLTVPVTDYTVGDINENALDMEQYVLVSVNRAGKGYKTVFPITIHSKDVTSIELENPQYKYLEGATTLNLADLRVKANYSNAESEYVTDYVVNEDEFNPELLNEEQNITVTYTHAKKSASATFPVIIYGIPVVSVDTDSYAGGWTDKDVTFTLSSTHQLDGVKYYFKTDSNPEPVELDGNTLTINSNIDDVYYFKAINSSDIESEFTQGFEVKRDDVTPSFSLTQTVTDVTNKDYAISISDLVVGISGIKSVIMNGADITATPNEFTVSENGIYEVVITANNGLSATQTITIENIDKDAPTVNSISIEDKENGGFARLLNKLTFNLFFNNKVEITIDATDKGVAGIDRVEYRFLDENGEPIDDAWKIYDESSKPTQDPNFKGFVEARAIDKATNVSNILRSDGYVIDGENPSDVIVNATYNGETYTSETWVAGDVNVELSSTAFSDIYEYCYRVDGGEWISLDANTFTATQEGAHIYEFKAISNSNLESEISQIDIRIDRQAPVIRVDFEGTFGRWSGDGVKFKLSTEEESLSGVSYYYNSGNGWVKIATGEEIVINYSVNATFRFKAINNAGTESYPSDSYAVMIDAEEPTISLNQTVTDPTSKPYDVEIQTTSGNAGLKSILVNGNDVTNGSKFEVSKNGTYVVNAIGNNGKIATKAIEITNFFEPILEVTDIDFGDYSKHLDNEFGYCYSSQPEIAISINNTGETQISKIEYCLLDENGKEITDWLEYDAEAKPKVPNEFKGYVEARVTDDENNISLAKRSKGITVDATLPTTPDVTAVDSNGNEYNGEWISGEVTFNVNSSAFSGIFEYWYRIDGGKWQKMTSNSLSVNSNGERNIEFKAVSNSTLESDVASSVAKIENEAPALQVAVDGTIGTLTDKEVVFTLSAPNALSGVKYYYSIGDGWVAIDGDTFTVATTCSNAYRFKAVNGAGVESYVSPEYKVIIEIAKPDVDALAAAIKKYNALEPNDYSTESFDSLASIVEKNEGLIDTAKSQAEVDKAVEEILFAIYELQPYLNFIVSAENGSYQVTCNDETSSNGKYSLLFGTKIELSATANEGYEFVGWYDVINNLYFSKNSEYTFKITANTNLKAIFVKVESSSLIFAAHSNWVKKTITKTVSEWESVESIDDMLPEVPYRYGYSNGRWVYDNDEVLAKLKAGENVSLVPEYDEDDSSMPTPREAVDGVPALDLYYNLDAEQNVGSFVMAAGIPEDCNVESVGIAFYYKKASEFDPTKFELLVNNKMLVSRFNTDEIQDVYITNMKKLSSTYNWAVRGYVTYYDNDGNLKTAYSNQVNIVDREQV